MTTDREGEQGALAMLEPGVTMLHDILRADLKQHLVCEEPI
jgi:hypothetical protein